MTAGELSQQRFEGTSRGDTTEARDLKRRMSDGETGGDPSRQAKKSRVSSAGELSGDVQLHLACLLDFIGSDQRVSCRAEAPLNVWFDPCVCCVTVVGKKTSYFLCAVNKD